MALRQAMIVRTLAAFSLAILAGGCGLFRSGAEQPPFTLPIEMAAREPALGCPWVDNEPGRAPVRLTGLSSSAPVRPPPFVPGCAIVRFRVAADGSVAKAALRAAYPLNDGPTALSAVQAMRFQPARRAKTLFVLRLSMTRDSAGRTAVTTEARRGGSFFGG